MKWGNILLLVISITLSILIAELSLRLAFKGEVVGIDEEDICNKKTYLSVNNISDEGRFHPGNTDYFEYWNISGVRPKPGLAQYYSGIISKDGTRYEVYSFGHIINAQRIKSAYPTSRTSSALRIAAVGDSFTYGENVLYNYSYPEIMRKLIPGSEVLNFGVQGAGFDQIYLRYKYDVLQYDPDVVVVGIYIDDIRRMRPCIFKPKFIREGDILKIENFPPPPLEDIAESYTPRKTNSYLWDIMNYKIRYFGGVKKEEYEYGLHISELLIQDMKADADQKNMDLIFLLISEGNMRDADDIDLWALGQLKDMILSKGLPVLTSDGIFGSEGYVPVDPTREEDNKSEGGFDHFTPVGYAYLAQGLVNLLENLTIIEPVIDYEFSIDLQSQIMTLRSKCISSPDIKWEPYYRKIRKDARLTDNPR